MRRRLLTLLTAVLPFVAGAGPDPDTCVLGDFERESWKGLERTDKLAKDGRYAGRWGELQKTPNVRAPEVPADWTRFDRLLFWLYSEKANGQVVSVGCLSGSAEDGANFYKHVLVDWQGWRLVDLRLAEDMRAYHRPAGWHKIDALVFAGNWSGSTKPDTVLYLDSVTLLRDPAKLSAEERRLTKGEDGSINVSYVLTVENRSSRSRAFAFRGRKTPAKGGAFQFSGLPAETDLIGAGKRAAFRVTLRAAAEALTRKAMSVEEQFSIVVKTEIPGFPGPEVTLSALMPGPGGLPSRPSPPFPVKHPALKHDLDPSQGAAYEKAVARIMAMSDEELRRFIPDKPCRFLCYCPTCHIGGAYLFTWTIDRPDEITCTSCGTAYPNDKYPMDQTLTGRNALGETVTYAYFWDRKTDAKPMFADHAMMFKRRWLTDQCGQLGRAYHVTRKSEYARRLVLILDRLTEVYARYPVMEQDQAQFRFAPQQEGPYDATAGKWGQNRLFGELLDLPLNALDLAYDNDEFTKLSAVRGYDVRARFEKGFLRAGVAFVATYPKHTNNSSPGYLQAAIQIGRVIGEPQYVHWAYRWLLETLNGGFCYDGMWKESVGYHNMALDDLLSALGELKGYSDPPGYVDPMDGTRFDNIDPEKDISFLAKARGGPVAVAFPNGGDATIHDTWAYSTCFGPGGLPAQRARQDAQARQETVSTILPGFGHAALGRGQGSGQMQTHLHFSAQDAAHHHQDSLNLTLYAKERELLSDIGYAGTPLRCWARSTVSHNTVVVDRMEQQTTDADGDLLSFLPRVNGVAVVEADGRRAYAKIRDLTVYRRLLVQVPVSAADAYVVDLFRVEGGSAHDWLMHGDADRDMSVEHGLKLTPRAGDGTLLEPGEKWVEPRDGQSSYVAYGVIREVQQGQEQNGFSIGYHYPDEPQRGVNIHLAGDMPVHIFLGRSPSNRRSGPAGRQDGRKAFDFWMPQLVVRRSGAAPLRSTFAAVEEPFNGKPFLRRVEEVPVKPAAAGATALRIVHTDGTTDTVISTLDEPPYPERSTPNRIRLRGRLGIVRQTANSADGKPGKVVDAWLFEGTHLAAGSAAIGPVPARHTGTITAAFRKEDGNDCDGFVTDMALPAGAGLQGTWVIVTHGNGLRHGYEIDRIVTKETRSLVVLTNDHGLRIDGDETQEVHFPRRTIKGKNTFTIPLASTLRRE